MSTIINNNAITKMYKGDTPIYSFSINTGGTGSGLDFSSIGYDSELTKQINDTYNADIAYSKQLLDEWDNETTTANSLYFENMQLKYAPCIDTSNVTDMNSMFVGCYSLEFTPIFNTSNVTDMSSMFAECKKLKIFSLSDTSNVTNMEYMFSGCEALTTIPLFNTENVTNMLGMFNFCYSLTTIPLFNTSNVTDMSEMFSECYSLTTIPLFNTSNVTYMTNMFSYCQSLTTIPLFNTSNVTSMGYMFYGCSSLTSLPKLDCTSVINAGPPIGYETLDNLTDLGGFTNLKVSWDGGFLDKTPNLTIDSLMNVINNLWDWTDYPDGNAPLNDGTIYNFGNTHTLSFGQTNLDKLTPEQIAVATAKGWTLTA